MDRNRRNPCIQADRDNFVTLSLETHLFFARIMKEHALFLLAGFPSKNRAYIKTADEFRSQFEAFLGEAVSIAGGRVSPCFIDSGEMVTEFTLGAERKTSALTGIGIDSCITRAENNLQSGCMSGISQGLCPQIHRLNRQSLRLVEGFIHFKEKILKEMASCQLFTFNYPLLVEHILREAKLYRSLIMELERTNTLCTQDMWTMENFWNQIMMEHALFIRGLLDPSEEALIDTADDFAKDYKKLLEEAREKDAMSMVSLKRKSIEETLRYRDFKAAGTKGISDCEIAGLILPLLADHVLREANHYLRLLGAVCSK